jgi:hypothetical protein
MEVSMYARIARFTGGSGRSIDAEVESLRRDLRSGSTSPGSAPQELMSLVTKMTMMADRETGESAMIVFCDSEEDVRKADAILEGMSPQDPGTGGRSSVKVYEVLLDEDLRRMG